jgi:DNA processing protein
VSTPFLQLSKIIMKKHKLTGRTIPGPLQTIPSPPKDLFVISGSDNTLAELLAHPRVAIVGARKVTSYGKTITEQLARELAQQGVVIISGLALGVDGIAHQACLEAKGQTIAVLPTGLDNISPRAHVQLARDILQQGGVLLSEYPEKTSPLLVNFIARNRLVAGLADAVLITEAAEKSGTLHTANFALEQGKSVFAVPGNITSPMSKGCNKLIKAGAAPVTEVEDILAALHINTSEQTKLITADTKEEHIILGLLQEGVSDGHELLTRSELSPQVFNQTLTMLEISGTIKPLGNNLWAVK